MTKSSEKVNVPYTIGVVDEAIAWDRREFIKEIGVAIVTVQCLPLIAHAARNSPSDGEETADDLIIHSGPGLMSHMHDLLIPYAVLNTPPPQGIELETTRALLHRHEIVLTQEQLILVNQGGTVTQKASSHVFVIALPAGSGNRGVVVGE
jgi:hypothetical protein